jgi:FAD:protein FMN transferase
MVSRRRFLSLTAVAAGVALLPGRRGFAAEPLIWRGNAMGAAASMILYPADQASGQRLLAACLAETERLEQIFSLYRPDSALVRLNRQGTLAEPPVELVELLSMSRHVSMVTAGAFDVTVQPLWDVYSAHFAQPGADPKGPPEDRIAAARQLVDWRTVRVGADRIALRRPGAAITLNGIAQGYITDKVADLLRRNGMRHVLVNMDDIRAVGPKPDGTPWRVGLEGGDEIPLVDRAVSTSAPAGTQFSPFCNHIFVPATGHCSTLAGSVSVVATTAAMADALSTAIAAGDPSLVKRLATVPGVELILERQA